MGTNPKKYDELHPSVTYTTNEWSNEFPVTYTANNTAAMDANDANIYNAENYNEELEKATALNINITTSVDPNFKDKKTKASKRYEIVVTAKNGEEKKIVVTVQED